MTPPAAGPPGLRLVAFGLALAALGQVLHLAHWPLRLLGAEIPWSIAIWVAFVRLAVYAALFRGLLTQQPYAWAGTFLELVRTFLFFAGMTLTQRWGGSGILYPAAWSQGLLSAGLPGVFLLQAALGAGWRPGYGLEFQVFAAVHVLAGGVGFSAAWLRGQAGWFGVARESERRTLLAEGLPIVLLLAAVEGAAYLLAAGGGPR